MNLTDELRKLADLHKEGHLTDEEFANAKHRLIADSNKETYSTALKNQEDSENDDDKIEDQIFSASRWSSGNMFFPDTLTLASDGMLFRKGALFGSSEEHINYQAIASIKVTNGFLLSNISVETSGGSQPVFLNGFWKSDAKNIQDTIRKFQK